MSSKYMKFAHIISLEMHSGFALGPLAVYPAFDLVIYIAAGVFFELPREVVPILSRHHGCSSNTSSEAWCSTSRWLFWLPRLDTMSRATSIWLM